MNNRLSSNELINIRALAERALDAPEFGSSPDAALQRIKLIKPYIDSLKPATVLKILNELAILKTRIKEYEELEEIPFGSTEREIAAFIRVDSSGNVIKYYQPSDKNKIKLRANEYLVPLYFA